VGRTRAVQLAPGVRRVSAAPADRVNSSAVVNDDVVAFTHAPEIRRGAREAVRGFLRDKAGVR
jgi:hypothetical protein